MNQEYWSQGGVRAKKLPHKTVLLEMFDYNPFSGMLVKRGTSKNAAYWLNKGMKSHYAINIQLDGHKHSFRQSRLIYAWHFHDPGCFQVDHIDGNRRNERISNLRLATNSENNMNKPSKGYYFNPRKGLWIVDIIAYGKRIYGGRFLDRADAENEAARLKEKHHGEFANLRLLRHVKKHSEQLLFDFSVAG